MTRTVHIIERRNGSQPPIFDVFEEVECADGRVFTRDIAELGDRDVALALARYCSDTDPDLLLHSAEVVFIQTRLRRRRRFRL